MTEKKKYRTFAQGLPIREVHPPHGNLGLFEQSLAQVNSRVLYENELECILNNGYAKEEFGHWIEGIPRQMKADVMTDHGRFCESVNSMLDDPDNGQEKDVYFYHSDHLGSASWITDNGGMSVQHLQYLPYGERYVDQRVTGYQERFTFTGKERDEETSYGYFGARYMDHELMTMWLSVDPMSDKYPGISTYAYCAWNPVKLVDPGGREISMDPYLIFNGKTNQLEIWDDNETPDDYSDDTFLGSFEAANNVASGTRKWPDGIYPTLQRIIVRNNRGSNQSSKVNFIHPYTKWEFPTPTIWIDATYVAPVHSISIP